jgi:hypothetical protein
VNSSGKQASDRTAPRRKAKRRVNGNGVMEPTKNDLKGELISFEVVRHEADYLTQFGPKAKTVVSLCVLTGRLSGEHFANWSVVGPIAAQMADCPRREMTGARVVERVSAAGHEYLVLDLELNESDRRAVHECSRWTSDAKGWM